jgi:hypothetical protein
MVSASAGTVLGVALTSPAGNALVGTAISAGNLDSLLFLIIEYMIYIQH